MNKQSNTGLELVVQKAEWSKYEVRPVDIPETLEAGQVLFRVDRFALTANNISYAFAGDMLDYWGFFPAEDGWGRIPVMGFADVLRSSHPDVSEGERFFGFFPMARHLRIQADHVGAQQISDAAPHRANHAPVYRQYSRASADPLYDANAEDEIMLLRGLFMTSFLVDDFVDEHGGFGAKTVLVSSASSKTSIALAWLLSSREGVRVVGLTSPRNADFVRGTGFYDDVVLYDDVASLPAGVPAVYVDMSGDGGVMGQLHHHYRDALKHTCVVGATHWDRSERPSDMPGPEPQFFFAPGQIQKRASEWGPEGLQERIGRSWSGFLATTGDWLQVVRGYGADAAVRVYRETLEGRADPSRGNVLSLWDAEG